jgi:hypothetical protein
MTKPKMSLIQGNFSPMKAARDREEEAGKDGHG